MSLVLLVAVSAVMTGVGLLAVDRLAAAADLRLGERLAFSFAVGWFVLYLAVFAVGSVRLDGLSMGALGLILAAIAVLGLRRVAWRAAYEAMFPGVRGASVFVKLLWLATALVAGSALVQGMAPPNDYDSLMYHLAGPQFDLEMGRIGVPWDRALPHFLFPALTGNVTRFALAISGPGLAQMLHGMLGIAAAAGAGLLTLRLTGDKVTAWLAALMFLSIRVVVWEMATVEVDVALAAFAVLALLAYSVWREHPGVGMAVLFGLMVGAGILTKYHGFMVALAFAPLIAWDVFLRRRPVAHMVVIGPGIAALTLVPHLARNFFLTGNPVFPIFNTLFNPGKPDHLASLANAFVDGYGMDDFLISVWEMFVAPMQNFDGMIFGAPFILMLAPLVILDRQAAKRWGAAVSFVLGYYALWFYFMGHQIRFLLPVMPVLAALAAVGAVILWRRTAGSGLARAAVIAIVAVVGANQAMFVGVYSALRLPVAVGVASAAAFHRTPTMNGAYFETCAFIRDNLERGEIYFSAITPHSYYCPQRPAVHRYFDDEAKWWLESKKWPEMSPSEFSARVDAANFRYFILPTRTQNRRNPTAEQIPGAVDFESQRFGGLFKAVTENLTPLVEGPYTAVYDGPEVAAFIRERVGRAPPD